MKTKRVQALYREARQTFRFRAIREILDRSDENLTCDDIREQLRAYAYDDGETVTVGHRQIERDMAVLEVRGHASKFGHETDNRLVTWGL